MARPKKEILKEKRIDLYCTNSQYLIIKSYAQKCKLSMSEYLLNSGLNLKVKPILTKEELVIFRSLIGMANNLNQLTKRQNQGEILKMKCINDLEIISELLKKFK